MEQFHLLLDERDGAAERVRRAFDPKTIQEVVTLLARALLVRVEAERGDRDDD